MSLPSPAGVKPPSPVWGPSATPRPAVAPSPGVAPSPAPSPGAAPRPRPPGASPSASSAAAGSEPRPGRSAAPSPSPFSSGVPAVKRVVYFPRQARQTPRLSWACCTVACKHADRRLAWRTHWIRPAPLWPQGLLRQRKPRTPVERRHTRPRLPVRRAEQQTTHAQVSAAVPEVKHTPDITRRSFNVAVLTD